MALNILRFYSVLSITGKLFKDIHVLAHMHLSGNNAMSDFSFFDEKKTKKLIEWVFF